MKVKNVMFSGVMAAILMSVAGTASAAIPVASKGYVDAKAQALVDASAETLQASIDTKVAQTAYDSKVEALESKDAELNTAISDMDSAYKQADLDLQASINTKVAQSAYDSKVAELAGAIADVKALTGNENVADQIATALNTAAQDATTKADAAKDAAIADAEAKNASLKTDLEGQIAAVESGAEVYVDQKVSELADGQVKTNKEAIAAMGEAYIAADTALDNKITNMGSAYEAADTALDGKISAMDEAYKAADNALDGKITDMDAAYKQADAQVLNSAKAYTDQEVSSLANGAVKANTEAIEALDGTYVSESEMTTFKTSNTEAIADAKKAGTDASAALSEYKTLNDAAVASKVAQSEYNAKVQALEQEDSQLAEDLAKKIEMPVACENTDCVLAYNTSTKTVSWTPLTEPTDEWLNK